MEKILLVFPFLVRGDVIQDAWPDLQAACSHQFFPSTRSWENITATKLVSYDVLPNSTHLFFFQNYDFIDSDRKTLFRLEACAGNISLYIRKTRPCWPNPFTGEWTHFQAVDGEPLKVLEVPSESTQWFISVYSALGGRYSLLVVPDSTSYTRLATGAIEVEQISADTAELRWKPAATGSRSIADYLVYSTIWFQSQRVLTTVCGLQSNTDHAYSIISCVDDGVCRANISSLVNERKYFLNVVAVGDDSQTAYSGIILSTHWDDSPKTYIEEIATLTCAVLGTVVLILMTTYFIILRIYT